MAMGLASGNVSRVGNSVNQSGKSGGDARGLAMGGTSGAGAAGFGAGMGVGAGLASRGSGSGQGSAFAGSGASGGSIKGGNVTDNSYIGQIIIKT